LQGIKHKAAKGLFWSSLERFSAQGVQFVLGLILARILLPEDYGLIGMLAIFLAISETFIQSGFGTALIQKKDRDNLDYSTTFYFNIFVAGFFYLLLFFCAPLIAKFYNEPQLLDLTRVIGFTIVINSFGVVQRTRFTVRLDFKTQTKASLSAITISGLIGIYLAYSGYGVWAIVVQTLVRRTLEVLVLWFYSKWLPKLAFSIDRFRQLFSFGSKLLLSSLLDTIYRNIYTIIIGKLFSAQTLGFYTRAKQLNDFPSSNMTAVIGRVTFPLLSDLQDDNEKLIPAFRRIIKMSALVIFPLMIGMASLAEPLIIVTLTDKWIESVWMLQLLCFSGMWYPIQAQNLSVLNVKGRSDLFLRLEIVKKVMITIVLVISVPLGIKAMIIGQVFTAYAALLINSFYTKRLFGYGPMEQIRDLLPVMILSIAMGAIVYYTSSLFQNNILSLCIGFIVGVAFYIPVAYWFNICEIRILKEFIPLKSKLL